MANHTTDDDTKRSAARLSPLEIRLLTQLREAPDRWLTALDLARQVLGREDPNGEIMVRQYVFRLRKRIEASGSRIEHVRTRGYRLVSETPTD